MPPEFQKPEYLHVLINHLPVIGLPVSALALLLGLCFRNRAVQLTGCFLVMLTALSFWPVKDTGEDAEDRIQAISGEPGKNWLEIHGDRADKTAWLFYTTAGVAAAAVVMLWKKWKWAQAVAVLVLLFALGCTAASFWIASAGGKIRHSEFRTGPP